MNGALYWLKVDRAEVGGYINAEGKFRVAIRGELSPEHIGKLTMMLNIIAGRAKDAPHEHAEELAHTGLLHTTGSLFDGTHSS